MKTVDVIEDYYSQNLTMEKRRLKLQEKEVILIY